MAKVARTPLKQNEQYVDKYCKLYGKTLEQALEDKLVKNYADYILKDGGIGIHEHQQNYGC